MNSTHPRHSDAIADAELALKLADARPTGPATDALRERLRAHIRDLAADADAYAHSLADGRARDIAIDTVRHARAVASDTPQDPAANLRLLAKGAHHLARYAAAAQGQRQ
ncbi:DUF6415 family natural product biosynthesis protein [Streptomyces sp. NBC_01381]|uniref:DUF6415 family natural product biosynthesis protein n=1 Tax=Streptomyces sp. NBC_01381 TaxID=2903845 RepID=UPI00224D06C6|nr:DUF6415 family natural product biosynthesis protein [Streptomyces sp. NBC_01381]MCX4669641.1 DUF6415 family natural product biosynthesis protein [Streptomyces sp. NBC_01381]